MMRFALFLIALTAFAEAAFPVVPLQWTPDQIAQSLRLVKPAMPAPDCAALGIQACQPGALEAVRSLSLHWTQLDSDPEPEAILIAEAKAEWNYFAYVFDWNKQWNLVGAIPCHRRCDAQEFIRVRQLTDDSPTLLIANRDDGGPDHVILMALGYQLRQGKLWPVFEWQRRLVSSNRDIALRVSAGGSHLILHTVTAVPPTAPAKHACHVLRWHSQTYTFVKDTAAAPKYCDARTGRPKPSNAHPIRLPADHTSSMRRRAFFPFLAAQTIPDFTCPMDPEVHAKLPGRCPRCGMNLVPNLPDPLEYRLHVDVLPTVPQTTATTSLRLSVFHPQTNRRIEQFEEIHEKQMHLFLISEDRQYFAHEHPTPEPGGYFRFHTQLPLPGFYRLLTDFFPAGGTPQLLTAPVHVQGPPQPFAKPATPNIAVRLRTEPQKPIAGLKTMLFFELNPVEGLMPWLGAWGHLLSASADLLDLVHVHPAWEPYRNYVQFNVIFPRPGDYTLWGQFQRNGVVNTARFDITASLLA